MKTKKPLGFTPLGGVLFCALLTAHTPLMIAREVSVIDESRMLSALAEHESGVRRLNRAYSKLGPKGERGAWQMKQATWYAYTDEPFERASKDSVVAHLVASMHLRRIRLDLERAAMAVTPYNLALAWKAGVSGMQRANAQQRKGAQEVENLYRSDHE